MDSILNYFFEKVYLINLIKRGDRLALAQKECASIGLKFKVIEAIDGESFQAYKRHDDKVSEEMRWNSAAAGLVKTTSIILEDAIKNNYRNILILEDDVEFHPRINEFFEKYCESIPSDWETFYFGASHLESYKMINNTIAKVTGAYCCHCYAINNTIYEFMYELISSIDRPIDHYTKNYIQPRGKSYCFVPNMAYQREGYSDIEKKEIYHYYLK